MDKILRSLYTVGFNVVSGGFDVGAALSNYFNYADEVVIATIKENNDATNNVFKWYQDKYGDKLKIVLTDITLDNPFFDGELKEEGRAACSNEVLVFCDMDERICGDIDKWDLFSQRLLERPVKAFFIPVINIYKDLEHFADIGQKWYLHKKTGTKRGVVNFAKNENGTINTEKSDSTELLSEVGNLVPTHIVYQNHTNPDYLTRFKEGYPFICHLGYLDLERRKKINKFWQPVWSARKGEEVKVALTDEELTKEIYPHGLELNKYFIN